MHVVVTIYSRRRPRFVQRATEAITDPLRRLLFGHEISAQHYSSEDISPYFWVNGRPPTEDSYMAMAHDQFANYNLTVSGLVDRPLSLTLANLNPRFPPGRLQYSPKTSGEFEQVAASEKR
jgi:DMSO/TMAO reductase YedYZ molybdopterin-dependent catalytic subunit